MSPGLRYEFQPLHGTTFKRPAARLAFFFIVTTETAERIYQDPLSVLELTYRATQRRI
jgi:hypothetical protein